MKLRVLALDYDGTAAVDDRLDAGVRDAIAAARARRIVVALVTGRRLDDLARVAGDLHFVDAVVAENGAVLHLTASGFTSAIAPPASQILVADLTSRGIAHASGACVVEAAAGHAHDILGVIHARELPLAIHFNRGRLMVLPLAVSKATGLRHLLSILRLSPRSSVAIGDAENDHELLRVAEVGVAVGWGSQSLRRAADAVVEGAGPPALAPYLRRLVDDGTIPGVRRARRALHVGHTDDGEPFALAVRGRNVLVAGDARSGKSWVAGLLAEQLILHGYSLCVIDPEGDYRALDALPGVMTLGGSDPLPRPHALLHALQHAESSVVIDLSHVPHAEKVQYARAVLPVLSRLRRARGLPHRIVIDEAHYFLDGDDAGRLLDLRDNGYTLVTYRTSHLPRAVLDASDVVLVTCESDPAEVAALHALCRSTAPVEAWRSVLGALALGESAVLPITEETGGMLRRVHLGVRITHHVRHREKYLDVPIGDAHAFVVAGRHGPQRITTLRDFVAALDTLPAGTLERHARASDFSRWLRDVFGDYQIAHDVQALETRLREENDTSAIPAIASAIRGRYDLLDVEGEDADARVAAPGTDRPL
jgi:hypothetical protein